MYELRQMTAERVRKERAGNTVPGAVDKICPVEA